MRVVLLAGGTGGAKLAAGIQEEVGPELAVIANTGDDVEVLGVHVSPDPDLVTYWLSGEIDEERGWGLCNNVAMPGWLAAVASVMALDLVVYLQHALFHAVPLLWRLHRVHHADLDFDVTTGARFHTVEILLSLGIKAAAIVLLGAPALAVLIFDGLLCCGDPEIEGNAFRHAAIIACVYTINK